MIGKKMSPHQLKLGAMVLAITTIVAFGGLIARTATRPMAVQLKSHIQICQKNEKGSWEVIDEVGPETLNFEASLLELASGKKVNSAFNWQTKSKKGLPYSVRLHEPASINLNPVNGQLDADLKFAITYDGQTAVVTGKLTTESVDGPRGLRKGKRTAGLFGHNRTSLTLVSANEFKPSAGATPKLLVCTEEYTLTPKEEKRK
ncbi:MAG TPA: hypothetical protein VGA99_12875 [bacterium]